MSCVLHCSDMMRAVEPALAGTDPAIDEEDCPLPSRICRNLGESLVQDRFKIQAHRRIMCELMCCCLQQALPTRPDQAGAAANISDRGEVVAQPNRQLCVEDAVGFHRPGILSGLDHPTHYAEVTYNMQFPNPVPMMDYVGGAAMEIPRGQVPNLALYDDRPLHYWNDFGRIQGRAQREFNPATRLERSLSTDRPRIRRPDVVVTRNPSDPLPYDYPERFDGGMVLGDLSNSLVVFEMKFPGDRVRANQISDYQRIAGAAPVEVLDATTCGCRQQRRRQGQPYSSPVGEVDLVGDAATSPEPLEDLAPGGAPEPVPEGELPPGPVGPVPIPGSQPPREEPGRSQPRPSRPRRGRGGLILDLIEQLF